MKVFSNTVTFDYSWEEVSTANWRKYCPWNEKSTHVIAVDTLSRTVDPATGILRTERLITCKQSVPDWLKSVLGSAICNNGESQVFETSYVDPNARSVIMVSQNLTWSNLLSVQETVVYQPSESSAHQTKFVQDAKITALCGGWQRIRNAIEDSLVSRFHDNAVKGREGFEAVLAMSRRVFAEEKERERLLSSATAAAVAAAGNPFTMAAGNDQKMTQ
ncbi:Phospholipid metabolism protein [Sporothrix epigloea]|uniref:Phospholipid metabolism protein n=1 Tax=Sporothrix epigloea TaxID=1892477 RepID=A0ABP0DV87_9PEZI